ncbi:MAG: hypothetical protein R3C53_20750 [Pirellulaceae bacterium]
MKFWMARIAFVCITAIAVWLVSSRQSELLSQPPTTLPSDAQTLGNSNELQVVSSMLPTGIQQLVLINTSDRTMAVYHVEPAQGKIQLRSVRNLVWDLRMEEFNGLSPLPSELRQVEP